MPCAWRATDNIHGSTDTEASFRASVVAWVGSATASRNSSSASATCWLLGIGGPFPHHPVTTSVHSQLEFVAKASQP